MPSELTYWACVDDMPVPTWFKNQSWNLEGYRPYVMFNRRGNAVALLFTMRNENRWYVYPTDDTMSYGWYGDGGDNGLLARCIQELRQAVAGGKYPAREWSV